MRIKDKIYKALVYRMIAFIFVLVASFIVTGSLQISAIISVIDLTFKTVGYFIFEVLWEYLRGNNNEQKGSFQRSVSNGKR